MIPKLLEKYNHWNFDKKMRTFIFITIIVATTIILTVSTFSSAMFTIKQSKEMAEEQLSSMASNYEVALDSYKKLALALIMDSTIQNCLTYDNEFPNEYYDLAYEVRNTLLNSTHVYSNINFVAVVNYSNNDYIYKGDISSFKTRFKEVYKEQYKNSMYPGNGAFRLSYDDVYFNNHNYTLSIYYPVYSTKKIGKELGLLCINVNDNNLEQIITRNNAYLNSEISLVDNTGKIISISDNKLIGTKVNYLEKLKKNKGSFVKDNKIYIYQKVGKWNYYLIYGIPTIELLSGSFGVMGILIIIIFVMVLIALLASNKMVKVAYKPLDDFVSKMDDVSEGKLDVRMQEENIGDDFTKLAVGFNSMMDEIIILMEQVKQEQHQLEQIRFNALQSQIKPHFLYNTLDCIHWQAVSDGNKEVSTLVKALASYYKICLSKGKDVITLEREIEHVKNYLIIQNMRYDNIIESVINIDVGFYNVMIPKMTLQPLVENSIYHGIKIKEGKSGKINLCAEMDGDDVIITLADSGSGMTQEEIDEINSLISEYDESFGYGVRNANKRIELLFGMKYGLHYLKNKESGITVQIRLPFDKEIVFKGVL